MAVDDAAGSTLYRALDCGPDDPRALQPAKITIQLKPHQLTALHKMASMEQQAAVEYILPEGHYRLDCTVGILGDKVGHGKTLAMLALIASDHEIAHITERVEARRVTGSGSAYTLRRLDLPAPDPGAFLQPTLVIVPHGPVFAQWRGFIQQQTSLRAVFLERKSCLGDLPEGAAASLQAFTAALAGVDVVLVSGSFYRSMRDVFPFLEAWRRIVVDEAHCIRVPGLQLPLRCRYAWFVTATPQRLTYAVTSSFIRTCFAYAESALVWDMMTVRNTDEYLLQSFIMPQLETYYYLCRDVHNMTGLLRVLPERVLDMLNANDFEAAVCALGGRVGVDTDIVALLTADIERDLNNRRIELRSINMMQMPASWKQARSTKLEQEIGSLENKLAAITERMTNLDSKECTICYCGYTDPVSLGCTHVFCAGCVFDWMRTQAEARLTPTCPQCKGAIERNQIVYLHSVGRDGRAAPVATRATDVSVPELTKIEAIVRVLEARPDGRFIVFSNHYGSFPQLVRAMDDKGISNRVLMGQSAQQMKALRDFRSGALRVIMLNTWHSGAGIDLHDATDLIMYQKMDAANDVQVVGRANRPGRTEPLRVHRMLHANEIERDLPDLVVMR